MRILMIGAHPDDCEFKCSGLALKYVRDGHQVRFLSVCDGSGGHHEMNRNEIAARRWKETRDAAEVIGIEYDVWNIPDCELVADLATRERMVRYIRAYAPDAIFCHRTNDYHADHRNAGVLVQDASYLVIVPNYCSDVPALREMPVILNYEDSFKNPVFEPDVVMSVDDVFEWKCKMADCHVSQMYEWLPFTRNELSEVPVDKDARFAWLVGDHIDADTPDEEILSGKFKGLSARYAKVAARFRKQLIEHYGEDGNQVVYAEAYAVCEYGSPLTEEKKKILFPY